MSATSAFRIPFNDLRRGVLADDEVVEAVERVARSGWYLSGEETALFETELAEYLGVRHVVGVASGTDALQLALMALGGGRGGEIVTAANAGGYGAIAARCCGMGVRYADVDENELLLTPAAVEAALTPQTTIVIVTHLYGKMASISEICDVCHAKGILVVEDCAQAAGAQANGHCAGSIGDAAAFSFYPTKNLGAIGDGGAVSTSDEEVAARVRRLAQYGWGKKYLVEEDGGKNSRLDEVQAAVLRVRLPRLDELNRRRRNAVRCYADALPPTVGEMVQGGGDDYVAHLAVVRSPSRSVLAEGLRIRGIHTEIHYPVPDHRQRVTGVPGVSLPVTEAASRQVLSLPCFPDLTREELEIICAALREIVESL